MAISKEAVQYVSHLARIELPSKELEKLSHQLQDILDFIDKLTKLDVKHVSPTSHILPVSNVLRKDLPRQSLLSKQALENAPTKEGNFFSVPKVIE
jgi:aspartyl-tRNA(Asn)/glutamyl-tRNA(Gln) amidotransferase subunit C